jgi:hypothetical protein
VPSNTRLLLAGAFARRSRARDILLWGCAAAPHAPAAEAQGVRRLGEAMRALTAGGLLLILTFRGASAQGASVDSLQFASYPAASRFHTAPAPVDLRSHKLARRFRTVLRKGAARGPNFAGAFTIVTWGCGSSCRLLAVVSARSGRVYGPWMQYMVAVAFKPSSRLLLIDPPDSVRAIFGASLADDRCVVCGTPGAYLWENDHFRALVQGPHVVSHTR